MSAAPRIVSLVPSLTELVCELGLARHLVGRTGFCVHPSAALAKIPKVGGTKTVNIERIRRLAPTHCIVNIDENEKPTVDAIARFVPNIVVTHPIEIEDNLALYRQFGELFDAQSAAQSLCDRLEAGLARVDAQTFEPIELAYLIWNDPWMSVSPDTFIARMLARVGLVVAGGAAEQRYPVTTPQALAATPLRAVLLSSEPCRFKAADRMQLRDAWIRCGAAAPAVLGIDGEMTSWYGPRAILGLDYLVRYRERLAARLARRDAARASRAPRMERATNLATIAAVGVIATWLTACSTVTPPSDTAAAAPPPGTAAPGAAPARPPASPAAGGRFYLDDGPGDRPLSELENLPDAVPRAEPLHRFANRPYTQFGRHYQPMTSLEPFRERGIATWYGRRYHNRPTSTGERYDMYAMTAAHPTLPLPSYARVTHMRTGRSIVVRVNDRGPFVPGRVIDLSYAAAAKLGTAMAGSAEVEVELIIRFDVAEATGTTSAAQAAAQPEARAESMSRAASTGQSGALAVSAGTPAASPSDSASAGEAGAARALAVSLAQPPAISVSRDPGGSAQPGPVAGAAPRESAPREAATYSAPVASSTAGVAAVAPDSSGPATAVPASAATSAASVALAPGRYVQLGAYQSRAGAQAALERLRARPGGLPEAIAVYQDGSFFKLLAGPYPQTGLAQEAQRRLRAATGIEAFQLVR